MKLLHKTDSGQNTVFVFEDEGKRILKINTLTETHSIYNPDEVLVEPLDGHYWNFVNLFPYMTPMKNACILGLGAGTMTRQLAAFHPQLKIDGVEIDEGVIKIATEYFFLKQPNLTIHKADGVEFIRSSQEKYDLIVLDAFDGGNLSLNFMTQQFFEDARTKMSPGGYFIANYIYDENLHKTIKRLCMQNFKDVFLLQIADSVNHLIIGTERKDLRTPTYIDLPERLKPLAEYMAKHLIYITNRDCHTRLEGATAELRGGLLHMEKEDEQ